MSAGISVLKTGLFLGASFFLFGAEEYVYQNFYAAPLRATGVADFGSFALPMLAVLAVFLLAVALIFGTKNSIKVVAGLSILLPVATFLTGTLLGGGEGLGMMVGLSIPVAVGLFIASAAFTSVVMGVAQILKPLLPLPLRQERGKVPLLFVALLSILFYSELYVLLAVFLR